MVELYSENRDLKPKCVFSESVTSRDWIDMTCTTIDLDTFEEKPSLMDIGKEETLSLLDDFQSIDAELLDYGIREDEVELPLPVKKEEEERSNQEVSIVNSTSSFVAVTQKHTLVNDCNIPAGSKFKSCFVKLVNCDKYPWYYTKYKYQILERKHRDALKYARNIMRRLKNDLNPPIIIDLDDSNDSADINMEKKSQNKDDSDHIRKKLAKLQNKSQKKEFCRKNDTQINLATQNICSTVIDLKKNKGLVGMRVQRTSENDKTKENSQQTCTKTSKITKTKIKKDINKSYPELDERHTMTDENVQNYDKNIRKVVDLKCSLKIKSPKILMKIKRMTQNDSGCENLKKAKKLKTNHNKSQDNDKVSENYLEPLSKKYKPMPKSKRIALEPYNSHIKDLENEPNKLSETISMEKSGQTNNNKVAAKKSVVKKKEMNSTQTKMLNLKVMKSLESAKNIPDTDLKNNCESTTSHYNALSLKETQSFIERPTDSSFESIQKTNISKDNCDSMSMKKKVNNSIFLTFTHITKDEKITMPQSPMPTTNNTLSSSSDFLNQRKKDEGNTKLEAKTSEYNIPPQNYFDSKDHVKDNILIEPNMRTITSTFQEPCKYAIFPNTDNKSHLMPSNFYHAAFQSNNRNTTTIDNDIRKTVSQPNVLLPQDIRSNPQQYDGSIGNSEEYILSDNIGKEYTLYNNVMSKSYNLPPPIIRPPIVPILSYNFISPNIRKEANQIVKPHQDPRFQRPPVYEIPRLPQPQNFRHRTPNYLPPRQKFSAKNPLREMRYRINTLRQPNYVGSQPRYNNFQRTPWNNLKQQAGMFNAQNVTRPPPPSVYTPTNNPEMLQKVHNMPPGISDVRPNNMYRTYYCPSIPSWQSPRPSFPNSAIDAALLIAKNSTGHVKKINIPSTQPDLSNEVIIKQEPNDTHLFSPTIDAVTNSSKTSTNNTETKLNTVVSTTSEIIKELDNSIKNAESPPRADLKIINLNEASKNQPSGVQANKTWPISKKTVAKSEPVKKKYSPPVLPIPTFLKALSEIQVKAPVEGMINSEMLVSSTDSCSAQETSSALSNATKHTDKNTSQIKTNTTPYKSFDWNKLRTNRNIPESKINNTPMTTFGSNMEGNVPKHTEKTYNILRKTKTVKKLPLDKEEITKKISLEDYKKRCLQRAAKKKNISS